MQIFIYLVVWHVNRYENVHTDHYFYNFHKQVSCKFCTMRVCIIYIIHDIHTYIHVMY
jgi:hypothetical protein